MPKPKTAKAFLNALGYKKIKRLFKKPKRYSDGSYWQSRTDLHYYSYIRDMVNYFSDECGSIVDVGSGNTPVLEWFPWASQRLSLDIRVPYTSENVSGRQCDILEARDIEKHDLCLCLQVMEHIPDPEPFARRLFELGEIVVISVPYKWGPGTPGHLQDPVDEAKLRSWTGRDPDYSIIVEELFRKRNAKRLISIYDPNGVSARLRRFEERRLAAE